jgi:hypothetical protein
LLTDIRNFRAVPVPDRQIADPPFPADHVEASDQPRRPLAHDQLAWHAIAVPEPAAGPGRM